MEEENGQPSAGNMKKQKFLENTNSKVKVSVCILSHSIGLTTLDAPWYSDFPNLAATTL